MWYAIYSTDVADSLDKRKATREAHLARAKELVDAGRMLLGGPRPAIDSPDPGPAGFRGSLIIAEFESLEAAKAWADDDPYVHAGVYQSVEVTPFIPVLP